MLRKAAAVLVVMLAGCGTSSAGSDSAPKEVPAKVTAPGSEPTTTDAPATTPEATTTTTEAKGSTKTDPLPIGGEASVGDFNVKITKVNPDANEWIATVNPYNDPPTNGRYVTATYDATYTGGTEGTPSSDLSVTLSGGNAQQYSSYDCGAVLGDDSYGTTIEAGGTTTVSVCFDAPPEAIEGGAVFIEDQMSFDNESRVFWALA